MTPSSDSAGASSRSPVEAFVDAAARLVNGSDTLTAGYRTVSRWRFAILDEEETVSVRDRTARFGISTLPERSRVRRLGGERFVLEAFLDDLTGTETVWDVGACVGSYAAFAAQRLTDGRLVAFEPEPTNRNRLEANLRANAPDDRWTVSPVALSDRDGDATLASEIVVAGGGHHYLSDAEAVDGEGDDERRVETRRGESLVAEGTPAPDVMKIDVQGAELRVLRGMGDVLENVDTIYAELHAEKSGRYGSTAEETEAFLEAAGFSVEPLGDPTNERSGVYLVRARR